MKIEIILPIPLPTWNRLLAMDKWKRKKTREMIHHAVSESIRYGIDWPTVTEFQGKQRLTDSFIAEYLKMIRPPSLKKSDLARKRQSAMKKL